MSGVSALSSLHSRRRLQRYLLCGLVAAAVVVAMAVDTTVVKIGSGQDAQEQGFSAATYGEKTYPGIQRYVESHAVDAVELANALKANQQDAVKKYATGTTLPVLPVRFSGTVGEGKSGIFNLNVEGLPQGQKVRLQTGPVLTGTELRDVTGQIQFGDFTNQIEYQNAGVAINQALKAALLDKLDRASLSGKHIEVVGVFRLLTPNNWLVTPVSVEVK